MLLVFILIIVVIVLWIYSLTFRLLLQKPLLFLKYIPIDVYNYLKNIKISHKNHL